MEPDSSTVEPDIGRVLLERGIVTEAQLREAVAIQRQMQIEQRPDIPRLGELLVQNGYATADQIRDALAVQKRKILFCPKCGLHVNVDLRPDVLVYRCARCETALVDPPSGKEIKVVESTIMFVMRDPLPPEVQSRVQDPAAKFGKYIIVSQLGQGGVGIVHKAWDTYLGQYVALKRLKPIRGPKGETVRESHIASLLKEARSAVRLRHPHIATVYDVGRVGREFYMSLEYIEGRTLALEMNEARSRGKVSVFYDEPRRYLRAMRDVARAVHYAHTRPTPVIHCDLKPSNIMLDQNSRAFVLDFGLARNLRGLQEEPTGAVSGTPSYMAPEQASGHTEDIDARTDVHGLGTVLYELITGRPPFIGSVQSVLRKALVEIPQRPGEIVVAGGEQRPLPRGLEEVCQRCLEKDRDARYPSAIEVAEALDRILKGDTSAVRRQFPTPRPARASEVRPAAPPAAEPPAAPADQPPALSPRAQRLLLFGAGALAATFVFALILLAVGFGQPSAPNGLDRPASEQMIVHAAGFRSDLALVECRAALMTATDPAERERLEALLDEFQWMDIARARVVEAVDAANPRLRFAAFRLRGRILESAEIIKVAPNAIILFADGQASPVPWNDVDPRQILELAGRCVPAPLPAETLGLALYAWRAGLREEARSRLESLRGTEVDSVARRYLAQLGP